MHFARRPAPELLPGQPCQSARGPAVFQAEAGLCNKEAKARGSADGRATTIPDKVRKVAPACCAVKIISTTLGER